MDRMGDTYECISISVSIGLLLNRDNVELESNLSIIMSSIYSIYSNFNIKSNAFHSNTSLKYIINIFIFIFISDLCVSDVSHSHAIESHSPFHLEKREHI